MRKVRTSLQLRESRSLIYAECVRFGDVRPILDAAYAAPSRRRFVEGVLDAIPARFGSAVIVLHYHLDTRGAFVIDDVAFRGLPAPLTTRFTRTFEELPPDFADAAAKSLASTHSTNPLPGDAPVDEFLRHARSADLLSLNGWDAAGRGVGVLGFLRSRTTLSPTERRALSRLTAHLTAAARLLDTPNEPVAVLDERGQWLERDRDALGDAPLAELARTAAALQTMQRATSDAVPLRLSRITPRVDGDWTVVSRFVHGGDEHAVIRRNPAPSEPMDRLTRRERQVISLLQAGHHMKLIAYELGIRYATVRVLAARARGKLGR